MKTIHYSLIISLLATCLLTACEINGPKIKECPDWKAEATSYYKSMSIIFDPSSLPIGMTQQDLAGAFIGSVCRGTAQPYWEQDSVMRIYLPVHPAEQEAAANSYVVVRYYSAQQQCILCSDSIPYTDDAMLGSMEKGYTVQWHKERTKK